MAHLSPSAIFSPSVARQQLAVAKDWNYVDNWLSTKFNGKTPPPFERNNETLKGLLVLAALNESADEERELLARLEVKELQALQRNGDAESDTELLTSIEGSFTTEGETSLEALSSLSVTLHQPIPDTEKMGRAIIDLRVTCHDVDQASDRVAILEKHLNGELERANALMKDLQNDAYQVSPDLSKQTVDFQRKTKILAAKLPEFRDRVASLWVSAGRSRIRVEDVKAEEENFQDLLSKVKDLETQVRSYHGLPQDTDLARLELESVRVELRDLTRQRDSLFEGLVERESPRKSKT